MADGDIMNYADQGSACRIRHQAMVMAIGCSKTAPNFLALAELRLDCGIPTCMHEFAWKIHAWMMNVLIYLANRIILTLHN